MIVPPDDAEIAAVYAAAVAAAADPDTAADATARVFAAGKAPEERAATAIRLALRARPAPAFARMRLADAEAVALCRLLRLDVSRAADLLGVGDPELRRRLTRGLAAAVPSDVAA